MEPSRCTSLICNPRESQCETCNNSHTIFFGSGIDSTGKIWKWTFNYMFGPLFLRKDDEPLINQPIEKNPVWDMFDEWFTRIEFKRFYDQYRDMWS